ncbi:hypothetical protein AYO49_04105 [Verrucomicrobiaceae bacterium SCGC AG-212-N21]|nr:hypothetical protein AYO49_04105 [Verrucomicrobiaceae bacterium SCGC AG-212-N21]
MKRQIFAVAATVALGLPAPAALPAVQPFLDKHCMECHDAEMKKGGLDLAALSTKAEDAAAQKAWVRIFDRVTAGEMPPAKKPQPTADESKSFLSLLGGDLVAKHASQKGTVLRRLNRQEYQNTINDLLGVRVDIIDLLPEDGRAHGFDTVGEALGISAIQMQRYMEAAETALNAVLSTDVRPETTVERITYDGGRNAEFIGKQWLKREDGSVVVFNDGGFPGTQVPNFRARTTGDYRVKFTGYGYQIQEPVVFSVIAGNFGRGGDQVIRGFYELPPDKVSSVEFTIALDPGDGLKFSPQGLNGPDGHSPVKDGPDKYPGEGLAFQGVEIEGPLIKEWPPRGQKLLLGDVKLREVPPPNPKMRQFRGFKPKFVADSINPAADSRRILPGFLAAAFRRPVSAADAEPYFKLFDEEFAKDQDYLTALRTAAIAGLCSPEFLYLKEPAGKLDDFALASRLAYFLTRSAPDAELLKVAAEKKLTQPAALRVQTERLLNGEGVQRFIADFTDGWLNLREIDFTTPDRLLYPEFDELLQDSMLRETRSFIQELLRSNLSVANLIHSDFAILNARLARHYGIPGVSGVALQKVKLPPDSKRGGLLSQASVLKVSANGTNTSPVIRGVWVMERILGVTPQPPPPGTPGVEPDIRGAKTMREILDKHRSMESCNGCHRVIDPPGFALENYDVIGGWRDRFRSLGEGEQVSVRIEGRKVRYRLGPPVDAAGQLPSGVAFKDFPEFQKLLVASQDRVTQCVSEKLLTFATGREMGFSDRADISRIVTASKEKNHGIRELVHLVVQSPLFLNK